jgi:alcohol dehydrogenase class IV
MQKIVNGIATLHQILEEVGCKRLFLVVDSSYPFLNIKENIESLEVEEKVSFSDFTPNPLYEQVCKGIDLLKGSNCDTILAVGGGSAIDVAKCIKLAVLAEESNAAIIPPLVSKRLPIEGVKIPFIAIPTTAGTGSESTHNAVMYYEGAKQTVTNDGVLPDYAILEPSVLKTLPLYQKKCTMLDALCQGIESWWSVNSTEESYEYSRKAIELIMTNWRKYIFENDDEAAANIMLGANYGGRAINITATTAAHAMSYKITSLYKLPHGHAVAVCLPWIWKYMIAHPEKCIDNRGNSYLERIFEDISVAMGCSLPIEAINVFENMMGEMEMTSPISGNVSSDINELTSSVNPIRLKNNPVALDEFSIHSLYEKIIINRSSL